MRLQPHQLRALTEWEKAKGAQPFVMPPPKPKKKRSNEESQMQRALITWWQRQCRVFGVSELALFSIPNGGARSIVTGAILKAEGARKGVPDLFLAVPRDHVLVEGIGPQSTCRMIKYCGLFLELKRREGVLSPEQEVYHEILRKQGYRVEVCWSLMEAIQEITSYLNNK